MEKRITLFAGHYGSGKTNLALSFARAERRAGRRVAVADLDIVNPYFRTKDSREALAADGIDLVVSDYANSNVDFPALPKEAYSLFAGGSAAEYDRVIVDVGGDDRGALALGRYVDDIRDGGDYEMLGVVNLARPLTDSPEAVVETLREIEAAAKLKFTALVNNTNLGSETTAATVLGSDAPARKAAALMGIPLAFTSVKRGLAAELGDRVGELFEIDIQKLYYQLEG